MAVIGSGAKLEAAYAPGAISSYKDDDQIEIAAQAAQTIAGGPLLNAQGEVIGIMVDSSASGRSLAVPVNYLIDLIRRKQPSMTLALAGAKDVFYDWRRSDPIPRPAISKELEQKIITEVARAHRDKAPQPTPQASPDASPQTEGEKIRTARSG